MRTATRRFALWRADLEGAVCAAPEECVEFLGTKEHVPVALEHRDRGVTAVREVFEATLTQDGDWQFEGVRWPAGLPVGTVVTVTWQAGRDEVGVRPPPLADPLRLDGVDYFHEYDPRVVTREIEAGPSNRGKVLYAVRKQGRIFDDGSAVLPEEGLAARCGLGRGARGAFLLKNAVDQLIREGYLTRVAGSADSAGYPSYPAAEGQKPAGLLFYAPLIEEVPDPSEDPRLEHAVNSFVRKLPPGSHASERQQALHEQVTETSLEPGYTFVKKHHRGV